MTIADKLNLSPKQLEEFSIRVTDNLRETIPEGNYRTMWGQLRKMADEMQLEKTLELMGAIEDMMVIDFARKEVIADDGEDTLPEVCSRGGTRCSD